MQRDEEMTNLLYMESVVALQKNKIVLDTGMLWGEGSRGLK